MFRRFVEAETLKCTRRDVVNASGGGGGGGRSGSANGSGSENFNGKIQRSVVLTD